MVLWSSQYFDNLLWMQNKNICFIYLSSLWVTVVRQVIQMVIYARDEKLEPLYFNFLLFTNSFSRVSKKLYLTRVHYYLD